MKWELVKGNKVLGVYKNDKDYLRMQEVYKGVVLVAKYGDKFILESIKRPVVKVNKLEFIRGIVGDIITNESFIEGAKREAKEELNLGLSNCVDLGRIMCNTGTYQDYVHVVYGEVSDISNTKGQVEEGIKGLVLLSKEELLSAFNGKIIDSFTLAGYMKYLANESKILSLKEEGKIKDGLVLVEDDIGQVLPEDWD